SERELKGVIPSGMGYRQFIEQLKQGHLLLLNDSPQAPLLMKDNNALGSAAWGLNSHVSNNIEPTAQKALLARTQMSGGTSSGTQSKSLHPPLPMPTYIPERPRPDDSDEPPTLKYEYNIDIACSHDAFHRNVGCSFALAKTKKEAILGRWNESKIEEGTRYTLLTAFNEPKKLVGQVASISMGISPSHPVKTRTIGSSVALEGFIPVTPAVQLGERLGYPTEGFYYHLHDGKLIQEYRILGDKKWSFYATSSMYHRLDSERGYNVDQTAILVFWKLKGKVVENQHLIYLDRQITRDELDSLNDEWLIKHGVKLDIPALLETKEQAIVPRAASKEEQAQNKPKFHTVQIDKKTGERETWDKIAKQYGLTPLELLSLNPSYNKDPMSLIVGHLLNVEKVKPVEEKEPIYGFPPVQVTTINHPLNSYYDYSEYLINGSTVKAINNEQIVEKDIPVLSLKIYLLQSKQLAQSEKLESIAQGKKKVIKKGAKGDEVQLIQEALLKMKFDLGRAGADGDFGSGTESAIKTFQNTYTPTNEIHPDYKVGSADGVVGKNTLLALDEAVVGLWVYERDEFKFTLSMMQDIYPSVKDSKKEELKAIADELNSNLEFYKLDTPLRRTHFFAQIMQETGTDLNMAEYTNYRISTLDTDEFSSARKRKYPDGRRYIDVHAAADRVNGVFIKSDGNRVTLDDKRIIFNTMYGNRMDDLGNGAYDTDDGWNFRGRGLKQLTGRSNYVRFNDWHKENQSRWPQDQIDVVNDPDILLETKYATRSAAWFWVNFRMAEKAADSGPTNEAVDKATRIINSGTSSYAERKSNFYKLWSNGWLK
uniref:peptidoglycan-binding protein n=1 Tax=uncultured Vibrio sp. TaxID=114054 RepID=UPI002611A82E